MGFKSFVACVVFWVIAFSANSQNSSRIFLGATTTPTGFRIQTNDGFYEINAYNHLTLETSFFPLGDTVKKIIPCSCFSS
jgi:hypothetical protein